MFYRLKEAGKMTTKKGVVVERSNDGAIILLPTGEYRKINTRQYLEVGDLYEVSSGGPLKYVAVAVIMLALIIGSIDYYSVQAYANLTSGLELGVNRWGRVISVQAKNTEGQRIIDTVQVQNNKLEVAVEKITHQVLKKEQNNQDSIRHSLSVVAKDKNNQKIEEKMLKEMEKGLGKATPTKPEDSSDSRTINNEIQPEGKNDSSGNDKQVFKSDKSESNQHATQPKDEKAKLHEKKAKLHEKEQK